jgi:hypothetical protein
VSYYDKELKIDVYYLVGIAKQNHIFTKYSHHGPILENKENLKLIFKKNTL